MSLDLVTYFTEDKPKQFFPSPHATCSAQKRCTKYKDPQKWDFYNTLQMPHVMMIGIKMYNFLGGKWFMKKKIQSWQLQYFHIFILAEDSQECVQD